MNLIILAGGKGLRMLDNVKNKPKQLLTIANLTIIERIIILVKNNVNIEKIYVSISKENELLKEYLLNNKYLIEKLEIVDSQDSKGESFINIIKSNFAQIAKTDLLLFMGDTVFLEEEIKSFFTYIYENSCDIVMGVTNNIEGSSGMLIDKTTYLQSRELKTNYSFVTGCFYINRRIIEIALDKKETSLSKIFNNMIINNSLNVRQFIFNFFYDINDYNIYQKCLNKIE